MTVYGWDASHFDAVPSGARVVAEGFTFMTHKAGGDANDAELGAWWSALKPYRSQVLLGAYWVLYPGHGPSAGDSFLARLDGQCPGWRDGPFILQLDCEEWGGNPATKPGLADIRACANRLHALTPKLTPIVYAPKWAYGNSLTGLGFPLWASSYVSGSGSASALYPGDTSARWAPYSGQVPAVLQFTSSATIAGQTTCDANAFRGTRAELAALVAPGWETEIDTMAATQDQIDAARIALAQVFDEAANGTTATGRNFRKDFTGLQSEALAPVLAAVQAADANDPQQMAEAFIAAVGAGSATEQAAALKAVLTGPQLAALVAALTATQIGPATVSDVGEDAGDEDGLSVYDETTRAMREQRHGDIQGPGE